MKYLKLLLPVIISIAFLISCSGNNSADVTKNNDATNKPAAASGGGDAHFSFTIDGQAVSGGAIDQMQLYNTGSIVDVDQGKELLFYLSDAKSAETSTVFAHALRFAIPYKTGTVSFGPDEDGWGIEVDIKPDKDHQATYFSDSFTVNVSNLSSTRTAGTFSGKFKLREDALSPDYKKEIDVTDGKFDIPMNK
ncbi:MAG: hypothetical protein ABI683_11260 [Ginsengibacter sp.]